MQTIQITMTKLTASEGMMLTDGETFGREIYIGKGTDPSIWREVSAAEVEEIQAALEAKRKAEEAV